MKNISQIIGEGSLILFYFRPGSSGRKTEKVHASKMKTALASAASKTVSSAILTKINDDIMSGGYS